MLSISMERLRKSTLGSRRNVAKSMKRRELVNRNMYFKTLTSELVVVLLEEKSVGASCSRMKEGGWESDALTVCRETLALVRVLLATPSSKTVPMVIMFLVLSLLLSIVLPR